MFLHPFVLTFASGEFVNYSITVIRMNSRRLIEGFAIVASFISREALVHMGKGNGHVDEGIHRMGLYRRFK